MKRESCWWSSLALAFWMLSCAKAFQHQPTPIETSLEMDTIETTNAVGMVKVRALVDPTATGTEAAHASRLSYTVLEMSNNLLEQDDQDSWLATTDANATAQSPSSATADDDDRDRRRSQDRHHKQEEDSFRENLGDVVICTMVAAFVALQYRDIIRTCR